MKKNFCIFFLSLTFLLCGCNKEKVTSADGGSTIIPGNNNESPDFVTFSDGKFGQFPSGWKTYTWEIDNEIGHTDNFSLKAANYPVALVFTNKTMKKSGFVEFYSKGDKIDFFIDDVKAHALSSLPDGNWEKRVYALDTGRHQLKWQAEGVYKYIDDIRFYFSE